MGLRARARTRLVTVAGGREATYPGSGPAGPHSVTAAEARAAGSSVQHPQRSDGGAPPFRLLA
jgi:hypothetical protein